MVGMAMALTLFGCSRGPEPPRPDRSLTPERVELADHWEFLKCSDIRFTLRSGATVDVDQPDVDSPDCPPRAPNPATFGSAAGATSGVDAGVPIPAGDAPLIFVGSDGDRQWFGSADRVGECWSVRFGDGQGAYSEGPDIHLSTGPVLETADTFRLPDYGSDFDPFPLRAGDSICLNEEGRAESIQLAPQY